MAESRSLKTRQQNLFLYWHAGEENMPLIHRINLENCKQRLKSTNWNIQLVSLSPNDAAYAGNLIELPDFIFNIGNKRQEKAGTEALIGDVIRLLLLQKYGGAYFDASIILLRNSIEEIYLYQRLMASPTATLAGYSNLTFTQKKASGDNIYPEAKDGIELGILFARKNSAFIDAYVEEIRRYWHWKTIDKHYKDYPPFIEQSLTEISFLNEYHVHYSILHMMLARDPELVQHIATQNIHMRGKEDSQQDGPYSATDRFARGEKGYGPGQPEKLLKAFLPGIVNDCYGKKTTLDDRVKPFLSADLLYIPGYMRTAIKQYFMTDDDYWRLESAYQTFYPHLKAQHFETMR